LSGPESALGRDALSGHLTGAVYGRYAIVDEGMLKESEAKLSKLHAARIESTR